MDDEVTVESTTFLKAFKTYVATVEVQARRALFLTGTQVLNRIKLKAPVDTGRLRASYVATPGVDAVGAFVLIGSNVKYAPFVEYGTIHDRAQPHFRPGLESVTTIWATAAEGIGR